VEADEEEPDRSDEASTGSDDEDLPEELSLEAESDSGLDEARPSTDESEAPPPVDDTGAIRRPSRTPSRRRSRAGAASTFPARLAPMPKRPRNPEGRNCPRR
jgi:hypothetical protein